jgi:hypothetical protein
VRGRRAGRERWRRRGIKCDVIVNISLRILYVKYSAKILCLDDNGDVFDRSITSNFRWPRVPWFCAGSF